MENYHILNEDLEQLTDYEVVSYLVASYIGFKSNIRTPSLEELTKTLKHFEQKQL